MPVLVSVIIPTYNRAAFVGRAIQSALQQHLPSPDSIEVIVVDDESTDSTADVVQSFAGVRYLWQPNRREGAARNAGAAQASGTYLAFLDSDDFWLPGKLAADVTRFERHDHPALVYSRAINVDVHDRPESGKPRALAVHEGDVFWALARESFVPMSSVNVRAEAFRACGGFVEDPVLSGTADWELWLRMAARWPVGFVDQTATCIRVHAESMLSDPTYMEPAMLAGVRYALADDVVARRARGREASIKACMYVTLALHAYRHQDRRRSLAWLNRALATWPLVATDSRFLGALARAAFGHTVVRRFARARHSMGMAR
jgi:glycosyltransferase involved in cell wall biosynthesis